MAIGADFYVDIALVRRAGGKAVAASAHDADFVVSGMYGCFHDLLTSVPNHSILKDGRRIQQMEPPRLVPHRPRKINQPQRTRSITKVVLFAGCFERLDKQSILGHY